MRTLIVVAVLLAVAYAAPRRLAPLEPATGPVVNDEYIVVFNEQATDELVERHHQKLASVFAQYNDTRLRVMHQYHIGSFRGYSAHLNDRSLMMVRQELIVKYIDHNQVVTAYHESACVTQTNAPWGLARTNSEDKLPSSDSYQYEYSDTGGEGVDVYIIDTGIYIEHNDFGGRARHGADFIDGSNVDGNGHGTHVAGTVMGTKYGIAKKATAIAVRVLNAFGSGTYEQVIAGVVYVAEQHRTAPGKKSVANMSLGGGRSISLDEAVNAAEKTGVAFAVAAGNNNGDACNNSPAAADGVTTVAASDVNDAFALFSNYGECTEIIAPGVNVESAYIGRPDAVSTLSGTSMASPHVAGVMAVILGNEELTPVQLEEKLLEIAMKRKITGIREEWKQVNELLHWKCQG